MNPLIERRDLRYRKNDNQYSIHLKIPDQLLSGILIVAVLFMSSCNHDAPGQETGRVIDNFNFGWKFSKGDIPDASHINYSDVSWQDTDLPHDWSIEGPFDKKWASGTGYLPGGIGWYRKTFDIPENVRGKKVFIYFDGVYDNSEVWINEHHLGKRPNGYISFQYDLTPYLKYGDRNVIAVKVDHSLFADSRWYTGSGIYRDVRLITTSPVYIKLWGVFITTPVISEQKAILSIDVTLVNELDENVDLVLENKLVYGEDVIKRTEQTVSVEAGQELSAEQRMELDNPRLWDVDKPDLYKVLTTIKKDGKCIDDMTTVTGIRSIRFDADQGFFLNGRNIKLKGVCLHHDAGCLGAAVPRKVLERRMDLLKEMGCNAIRTSHNPYSSEFMDLCDEKGFLVMDEAFDEWELPKRKWVEGWNVGKPSLEGSAFFFREWHQKDLTDFILRDRNHPSVIMWSIGNEIDYPNDPYTHPALNSEANPQTWAKYDPKLPDGNRLGEIAKELVAIIKEYDTTRPVTAGLASVVVSNETGYAGALDIAGYNYQEGKYESDHKQYPQRVIYGSETGMSLEAWKTVVDNDYVLGQFLWTGIEYMGEAGRFPSRHSTAGTIDMAGNRKTEFYFRQSLWSSKPMVYIGTTDRPMPESAASLWSHKRIDPLWNYKEGHEIYAGAFTNCEEVELFLDNQSLGRNKMADFPTRVITWKIPFKEGVLKAVGLTDGVELASFELKTAGPAAKLVANADALTLQADKEDISHIEVMITDESGTPDFMAEREITCEVTGPARLLGMEDSNPRNIENYKDNKQNTYHGKVLLYIQSLDKPGRATVKVTSPGLRPALIELDIVK
jgi:beta-galactosidase